MLKKIGTAIGTGLMAGLAGTLAMTISQMIEMKITGREASTTPAKAAEKVFDLKPSSDMKTKKVSNEVHWTYGTDLGMIRGALNLVGLKGWAATALHFTAVWGAEMIMLPALKIAPPIMEESPKDIAIEGFHIMVYAMAAGCVFDAINKKEPANKY